MKNLKIETIVSEKLEDVIKKVKSETVKLNKLVKDLPGLVERLNAKDLITRDKIKNTAENSQYVNYVGSIWKILYKDNKVALLVSHEVDEEYDNKTGNIVNVDSLDYRLVGLQDNTYVDSESLYGGAEKTFNKNTISFDKENFDNGLFSTDSVVREMTEKMIKHEIKQKNAREKLNAGPVRNRKTVNV